MTDSDELVANQRHDEAAELLAVVFEKAVRRGMPQQAAEAAVRWVPILLEKGEADRAASVAQEAIAGLGDVPFGCYSPPCIGDTCGGEDPVPRQRVLVLELTLLRMSALDGLGRTAEAVTAGLEARSKAAQAGLWNHLGLVARLLARLYRAQGMAFDAYHSLAFARSRMAGAQGSADEVRRLDEALAALKQEIGDEAYQAVATECARRDPTSCKGLVP